MQTMRIREFLNDESGSYTIWALVWFMLYVGIGGLAVDITDAYRNQSLLQATADSSALAAVMSIGVPSQSVDGQANQYAAINMPEGFNGDVLADTDITVGTWNFTNETFSAGGAEPNAVHVLTRRSDENSNPVATNFLRIIGLGRWNVVADAVAVKGVDVCFNNGIIAGGDLDIKTHTQYWNNICLIGNDSILHRDNGNYFEPGVYAGVGCAAGSNGCLGPNENVALGNQTFNDAFNLGGGGNYNDPTQPQNALRVDDYIAAVLNLGNGGHATFDDFLTANNQVGIDYSGYEYLTDPNTGTAGYESVSALPADVTTAAGQYTIYEVSCGPHFTLPDGNYENLAIIANCPLRLTGNYTMSNALIASTDTGNHAISANGNVDLGAPGCGQGGVEVYASGDIHFASGGDITNTRMLSGGSVHMSAQTQAPVGVHIEAVGDVFTASGSSHTANFGLCPNGFTNGAQVLTFALVR